MMSHVLKVEKGALINTPEYKAMKDMEYAYKNLSTRYKQIRKYEPNKAAKELAGLRSLRAQMLAARSVILKMKSDKVS